MMTLTKSAAQREALIRNVLAMAATRGLLVTLGTMLEAPVRVHDRETDYPVTMRLRDVTADDVRCD